MCHLCRQICPKSVQRAAFRLWKTTQTLAEGAGFEPAWACARQFSSSTRLFACVCVWLYLATLRGFFAPAFPIWLRLVASVCGERCQNVAKKQSLPSELTSSASANPSWMARRSRNVSIETDKEHGKDDQSRKDGRARGDERRHTPCPDTKPSLPTYVRHRARKELE